MDPRDRIAQMMGGFQAPEGPVPRPGQNEDFDLHCMQVIDENMFDDREAMQEMRRALWATWRVEAPAMREATRRAPNDDEDEQLAMAIAESVRESRNVSRQGSARDSPIPVSDDDEDEELKKAIAMSEEEFRAPKRQKREETPDEERRMIQEALAASMAASPKEEEGYEDDDAEIEAANKAFQASRQAYREEELKRRQARAGFSTSAQAGPSKPITPLASDSVTSNARGPLAPQPRLHNKGALGDKVRLAQECVASSLSLAAKPEPSGSATALPATASATAPVIGVSSLIGDRAKMEAERLARQAARANTAGAASASAAATSKVNSNVSNGGAKVATIRDFAPTPISPSRSAYPGRSVNGGGASASASAGSSRPTPTLHPLQSTSPFLRDAAGEYYLDGEMRQINVTIGKPSAAPTFKVEQVIGRTDQISLIVMSSFVIDDEWLERLLPPAEEVPRVAIRPHPREQHPAWNGKGQAQDTREVRCYPKMVGEWGSAHMKYFWIVYKTGRLRVAILTANMVDYDWDFIENTAFVQDFLPVVNQLDPLPELNHAQHDFPLRFRDLFVHLKVHKALRYLRDNHPQGGQMTLSPALDNLAHWDWSRVRVQLMMSIPGKYEGVDKMDEMGICRLGSALAAKGWKPKADEVVKVEFQSSSLGAYTIDWMDLFYQYCCGKTTRALLRRAKPAGFPPIKVVFPSLATVDKSELGREGGGTMFCAKAFNAVTKKLFHDSNSKRGGVLMHAKVLIALFEPRPDTLGVSSGASSNGKRRADDMADENEGVGGWIYMGSHNFSGAAWGTPNVKKTVPELNVRNYEIGIIFPLPRHGANAAADALAPHVRPPRPYSDSDEPWDQKYIPSA